jgi:hypothetical protein
MGLECLCRVAVLIVPWEYGSRKMIRIDPRRVMGVSCGLMLSSCGAFRFGVARYLTTVMKASDTSGIDRNERNGSKKWIAMSEMDISHRAKVH